MSRATRGAWRARVRAAAALLACAALAHAGESRVAWAEIELHGPLRELVLAHDAPAGARASAERLRFDGELADGESRTLAVPVPVRETTRGRTPRFNWDVAADDAARGRAQFVRWLPAAPGTEPPAGVAPALRARPRPPVERSAPRVPAAALLALAAGALCSAAARRRTWLALSAALASGAVAALLVESGASSVAARVRVLEGAADDAQWLAVDTGAARLELSADALAAASEVALEPADAPLEIVFPLRAGAPVRLAAPRARIHVLRVEPALATWSADANPFAPFTRTWLRQGGAWSAHGGWGRGAPLPPPAASAEAAPGWLSAGLPQGVDVFVGEFARGGDGGTRGPGYLRLALAP